MCLFVHRRRKLVEARNGDRPLCPRPFSQRRQHIDRGNCSSLSPFRASANFLDDALDTEMEMSHARVRIFLLVDRESETTTTSSDSRQTVPILQRVRDVAVAPGE
jgi:hypothetical protein